MLDILKSCRLPPATRSELFTPFQPSIGLTVTPQGWPFKGNRPFREPGSSSHQVAGGWGQPVNLSDADLDPIPANIHHEYDFTPGNWIPLPHFWRKGSNSLWEIVFRPGGNPGANGWFIQSTPIQMPSRRVGICEKLTSNLPSTSLQGGMTNARPYEISFSLRKSLPGRS